MLVQLIHLKRLLAHLAVMIKILPIFGVIFFNLFTKVLAYTWPNLAYDYVEEFLWLELTAFAAIPPVCTASPDGTTPSVQAQWLRTVRRFQFLR
jgi:hypothetical protein